MPYKDKTKNKIARRKWRISNPEYMKNYHLNRKYKITLDDYNKMLEDQKDCCASCGRHRSTWPRALHVDHCHNTGKIRGLLCYNCNQFLGYIKDDPLTLVRILSYLKREPNVKRND
jgi:hypothetical protein